MHINGIDIVAYFKWDTGICEGGILGEKFLM